MKWTKVKIEISQFTKGGELKNLPENLHLTCLRLLLVLKTF